VTLTERELAEIEARAEAATPGPWDTTTQAGDLDGRPMTHAVVTTLPVVFGPPGDRVPLEPEHRRLATFLAGRPVCSPIVKTPGHLDEYPGFEGQQADADFIAHARQDIPALLTALRAERAAFEQYRESAMARITLGNEEFYKAEAALRTLEGLAECSMNASFGGVGITKTELGVGIYKDGVLLGSGKTLVEATIPAAHPEEQP
jgi:hypothetical protein